MCCEYKTVEMMSVIILHSVFSLTDLTEIHFRSDNVALNKQPVVHYHLVCLYHVVCWYQISFPFLRYALYFFVLLLFVFYLVYKVIIDIEGVQLLCRASAADWFTAVIKTHVWEFSETLS